MARPFRCQALSAVGVPLRRVAWRTMLRESLANPLVILDEINKIPEQMMTSGGGKLPGAFDVLKSMIEPTTARAWVCPFYQLPFDMTRVNWT